MLTLREHTEELKLRAIKAMQGLEYGGADYNDDTDTLTVVWQPIPKEELESKRMEIISDVISELAYELHEANDTACALEKMLSNHGIDSSDCFKEFCVELDEIRRKRWAQEDDEDEHV